MREQRERTPRSLTEVLVDPSFSNAHNEAFDVGYFDNVE